MERVVIAAVRCPVGKIYKGFNHAEAYNEAGANWLIDTWEEGFVTSLERFVDRGEAFRIAVACKQPLSCPSSAASGTLDAYDINGHPWQPPASSATEPSSS